MSDDTKIKRGGKNVFADLGYADPETHLNPAAHRRRTVEWLTGGEMAVPLWRAQ